LKKELIYCLPGLGLDHRVFKHLKINHAELKFIDWIDPEEEEGLESYANRMSNILPTEVAYSLLGVSLGGIISIEISKIKPVKHLFLISTIKNVDEMPTYLKWMNKFPLKNQQAAKFAVDASIALKPFYDKTDRSGQELFKSMVKATKTNFINWGVKQIGKWQQKGLPKIPFSHYHGTEDLIFPIKNVDQATTIRGGTHYMIYNDGEKISGLIDRELGG